MAITPYSLKIDVDLPAGRDDLVAGFCKYDPLDIQALLNIHHGGIAPVVKEFVDASFSYECQWSRYAMFSKSI